MKERPEKTSTEELASRVGEVAGRGGGGMDDNDRISLEDNLKQSWEPQLRLRRCSILLPRDLTWYHSFLKINDDNHESMQSL